ncbi:MAG: tRNA (guanosine(37)-N1)-methyltransferase TrmD [Pseudomonadota bacterium]
MAFAATVLTLYPGMFPGPLGQALAGRALSAGTWSLNTVNIRDFAFDKHRTVDGTPAGGGPGMVMRADTLAAALDGSAGRGPRWLMSARGERFTQEMAARLVNGDGVTLVCGRFEGVDERVIEARDLREVSIADAVLSGGEVAAMVVLDAVVRLLPGVMGNSLSAQEESFSDGLLEHPQYTKPAVFEGQSVPEVLTSGDHGKVAEWRRMQRERLTRDRRPDLWARAARHP